MVKACALLSSQCHSVMIGFDLDGHGLRLGLGKHARLVAGDTRLANRPGMARIIPELTHGVPCPGRGSFCPGNVKIDHRAWIYGSSLMSVLYFVLCLSVTHDLT